MNRRSFLRTATASGLALASHRVTARSESVPAPASPRAQAAKVGDFARSPIATNTYPWGTFARREGQAYSQHSDSALAEIAASGIIGYEPGFTAEAELDGLSPRLKQRGLQMPSIYVNSQLHDDAAERSIATALAIARRAIELGTCIVVTNPAPIRWGGAENKTDAQLMAQARALDRLGEELRGLGAGLAYHNHDIELRQGAREFHHMLTATDPAHVKFCLDAHWVYRGCGNSQVALFDVLELHGDRIVELHLRQSREGIWTEVFTADGDIDYGRLSAWLKQRGIQPHLVLEQAVEAGSPKTLDAVAAHRKGLENVRELFAWMV